VVGFYRRVGVLECGVVVMEQVTRGSRCDKGRGPVTDDDGGDGCTAKGAWGGGSALQRGGVGWLHGGGAHVRGARVSGGVNDPDVCGLWFQESLPLCMVITSSVLFSCLL
jgi:hypothetical protein